MYFFFFEIYIQIKKYVRENNHNNENVTTALFCYQNDLNINTILILDIIVIFRLGR